MHLLVTRPLPDGERTAQTLRTQGHTAAVTPLMRIEPVAAEIGPGPFAAVLFTSANAPRMLENHPHRAALLDLPVFTVGRASAAAARAAGFGTVSSADGDAGDLLRLVVAGGRPPLPLLYLAGEDRAGDLTGALAEHGVRAKTAVIYRAVAAPFPEIAVRELNAGRVDGVLHFSRRSASLYVEGATAAGVLAAALRPKHYCFAAQTAELLRSAGAADVAVAPRPQESALIALIG